MGKGPPKSSSSCCWGASDCSAASACASMATAVYLWAEQGEGAGTTTIRASPPSVWAGMGSRQKQQWDFGAQVG